MSLSASDSPPRKRPRKVYINHTECKKRLNVRASRLSGDEYVSAWSGKEKPGKKFARVLRCCSEKCGTKIPEPVQLLKFESFYNEKTKELQDASLASCIKKVPSSPVFRNKQWCYHLRVSGNERKVCRQFIIKLYQVSEKRIRVIQH
ncbi:unnamed protein product [Bemisia tabaci]|uniref:Uncharacterized protein n=1 Tax=Bemisia tabaci TaxID=7038 RepID=A0A9P0A0E0_BEMTA|nr:unnamed protein product [Bemisia tabaci]